MRYTVIIRAKHAAQLGLRMIDNFDNGGLIGDAVQIVTASGIQDVSCGGDCNVSGGQCVCPDYGNPPIETVQPTPVPNSTTVIHVTSPPVFQSSAANNTDSRSDNGTNTAAGSVTTATPAATGGPTVDVKTATYIGLGIVGLLALAALTQSKAKG